MSILALSCSAITYGAEKTQSSATTYFDSVAIKTFVDEINQCEMSDSGAVVRLVGDVKFGAKKDEIEQFISNFKSTCNKFSKHIHDENLLQLLGIVKEARKSTVLQQVVESAKSNEIFAKDGISE